MARSAALAPPTVKLPPLAAVPPSVWTRIRPEVAPAGTVAVICAVESIVKAALVPLKVTLVANTRFVPVITTLVPAAPLVGEKPEIAGAGGVWPSILFRSTVARFGGNALKKVKLVSLSIATTLVRKFCHGSLPTALVLGIRTAINGVEGVMRLVAAPVPRGTTTAISPVHAGTATNPITP